MDRITFGFSLLPFALLMHNALFKLQFFQTVLFPLIVDGGFDGVFCQYRAVDLYRRQVQFFHDLNVVDGYRSVYRFALQSFRSIG